MLNFSCGSNETKVCSDEIIVRCDFIVWCAFPPLLMSLDEVNLTPFANARWQSLLKSTSMGSHPLLMVDVKSTTVNENIFLLLLNQCIYKFNENIPENVLII